MHIFDDKFQPYIDENLKWLTLNFLLIKQIYTLNIHKNAYIYWHLNQLQRQIDTGTESDTTGRIHSWKIAVCLQRLLPLTGQRSIEIPI